MRHGYPSTVCGRLRLVAPLLLLAACAGGGAPVDAPPDPARFPRDPALFGILTMDPGAAQSDSLAAFEAGLRLELTDTLADIAEDPSLHPLVRANAVRLMGQRRPPAHFILLRPLLAERDERIRLAVTAAAREYLEPRPDAALRLLDAALHDPSPRVQARVLETVTDRDVGMLRAYLRRGPAPELARVARELIAVGEERGAPLEPTAGGALERAGPAGHRLRYLPARTWSGGELSAGELALVPAGGEPEVLGSDIEVARNVLPAVFSIDGRYLAYEKERTIVVREVANGGERSLGPGLAPRPLPFTADFVFVRSIDDASTQLRTGARLQYELRRARFEPDPVPTDPAIIGLVSANARFDVAGGASPVRWMRVVEKEGTFELAGDGIDPVPLPDPFGSRGGR